MAVFDRHRSLDFDCNELLAVAYVNRGVVVHQFQRPPDPFCTGLGQVGVVAAVDVVATPGIERRSMSLVVVVSGSCLAKGSLHVHSFCASLLYCSVFIMHKNTARCNKQMNYRCQPICASASLSALSSS